MVDEVDLEAIAERERVNRHDVKARVEEFSARAGHEHAHKAMTSRDLTENVELLQVRVPRQVDRPAARQGCLADQRPAQLGPQGRRVGRSAAGDAVYRWH